MRKQNAAAVYIRPLRRASSLKRSQNKRLVGYGVGFGLFFVVIASPGAPVTTWGLLLLWSLLGVRQSLQALTLLMLTRFLNPSIYSFGEASSILFYFILLTASFRIYLEILATKTKYIYGGLLSIIAFGAYAGINSIATSYFPAVSLSKTILFIYTSCAILIGFQITAHRRVDWTPWFLGMWLAVVTLSIPTIIASHIGYARDGLGFQGILSHPQAFAIFLVPMLCWILGKHFFSRERLPYLWLIVLIVVAAMLFMTLARTAVVAVVAATVFGFACSAKYRSLIIGVMLRPQGFVLIFIILAALPFVAPIELISNFVKKGTEAQGIGEAYHLSRGLMVGRAWENFVSHLFFGIGFGVSFEEYFNPVYDSFTGLPISAFVEKSLLPIVIMEELGLFGLIFFIPALYQLIRTSVSSKDLAVPLLVLGCLMVNIGEAVLFSIGGLGLYLWLLMGWGLSTAIIEKKQSTAH